MGFSCSQLGPLLKIVVYLLKIVQIGIPVILIVMITFDLVKGMTSNDQKQMEEAKSKFGKRFIYAVVIFLIPLAISMIFKMLSRTLPSDGLGGARDWISCFNTYY